MKILKIKTDISIGEEKEDFKRRAVPSKHQFDPQPSAAPPVLPPSLFSERAGISLSRRSSGWDISLIIVWRYLTRYCSKSY